MHTPFGDVIVLLDDKPATYSIIEKEKKNNFSAVLGCYRLTVNFIPDGKRWSDKCDYDASYLENGMSYKILNNTTEDKYVLGIAWINNVKDEFGMLDNSRDIQTWLSFFGSRTYVRLDGVSYCR